MTKPLLIPISKDKFKLANDFSYKNITVPKGYITNGANIPRFLWSIFPPNSPEYLSAIVVHDYLCDVADNTVIDNSFKFKDETQGFEYADSILYLMLLDLGVNRLKASIFYISCRVYHKVKEIINGIF